MLYIEHAAAYPEEQNKYVTLSKLPYLDIVLIRPESWKDGSRTENFKMHARASSFKSVLANSAFKGFRHRSFFTNNVGKAFRNFQPDIIHLFEEANTFFSLQALILKLMYCRSAKLIFDNFQNIITDHVDYRFYPLYESIEKLVFKHAICATARYEGSKQFLEHKNFKKRIYELPWGTDVSRFRPTDGSHIRQRYKLDGFTIGYIGRIENEKGIFLLLDAIANIKQDITLLVAGTGSAKQKMLEMAEKYRLGKKFRYVGYISHSELPAFYSALDCIVVPTITMNRCKEQFGRVLVEAMACKTPVIGSTSGAIPSVVGNAGLVFRENDVDDLVQKIVLLANNVELRQRYSQAGKQRVHQCFSLQKFSERCLEIYHEVLATSAD
ncbi:glycosyltransferase family 4 protein [candidate division KSB1 bacterium]|nr:glycosyltransferase family 4 protein [candidate division KSB1 bacterium]